MRHLSLTLIGIPVMMQTLKWDTNSFLPRSSNFMETKNLLYTLFVERINYHRVTQDTFMFFQWLFYSDKNIKYKKLTKGQYNTNSTKV